MGSETADRGVGIARVKMIAYCGSIDARKHGPTTEMNLLDFVSVFVGARRLTSYGAYNAYRMPVVRDNDEDVKQARKRRHKDSRRLYEKVDTVTEPIATAGRPAWRILNSILFLAWQPPRRQHFRSRPKFTGAAASSGVRPNLTAVAKTLTATTRALLLLSISHVNRLFPH